MSLLGAWALFPLLAAAVWLGLGLLVDRIGGGRVPGVLLLPLGFAALIASAQTITFVDPLAELVTAGVVALALAGLWLGRARLRPGRVDRWAAAAGLGVFAAYAAPIVLSGSATFAGYTLLGDNAIHFILADWAGEHGWDRAALPASSYQTALDGYIHTAYPLGAHAALAAVAPFGLQELPWVYQPFLALIAALAAPALYAVLTPLVEPRPLRALAAFVAAQPALMFGYALQGSIKELCIVVLVTLLAALVAWLWEEPSPRRTLVLAVPVAAGLGVLNLAVAPYIGPLLLAAAVPILILNRAPWRRRALAAGVGVALVLALSVPMLTSTQDFVEVANVSLTSGEEFGNLIGPLRTVQAIGIWPRGDYRFDLSENRSLGYLLIGAAAVAAIMGLAYMVRRRALAPLLLSGATVVGSAYAIQRGSPWADGKALMIVSPAVMAAAFAGAESLRRSSRRVEGLLLAAAVTGGVLWTNVLAYRAVDLAPRERLEELASIGERIEGQGPTLYPEFEEFAKYFLRDGAPTGSSESWQPEPRARSVNGNEVGFAFSSELDGLDPEYVRRFHTIVLRRSPNGSRPPSGYALASTTEAYEVWQRSEAGSSEVVVHVGIGDRLTGGGTPPCERLDGLADRARAVDGVLAYPLREPVAVFLPASARTQPESWAPDDEDQRALRPTGGGRIADDIEVATSGLHEVWLGGSFSLPVAVRVDGREVGTVPPVLSPRGTYEQVGTVELTPGRHRIEVIRPEPGIGPGDNGQNRLIGPVVLRPVAPPAPRVRRVPPARADSLCNRTVDWIEVLREGT